MDIKSIILSVSAWVKPRHPLWVAIPYLVASSFSTFPSLHGVMGLMVEWAMFFFIYCAWRWE